MELTLRDFHPFNRWQEEDAQPELIIDLTTSRKYIYIPNNEIRLQCFIAIFGTIILSIERCALDFFRVITFTSFWKPGSLKKLGKEYGLDAARFITAPLTFIGLELAAIYGLFAPNDGRKLYASIERTQRYIWQNEFQPV